MNYMPIASVLKTKVTFCRSESFEDESKRENICCTRASVEFSCIDYTDKR